MDVPSQESCEDKEGERASEEEPLGMNSFPAGHVAAGGGTFISEDHPQGTATRYSYDAEAHEVVPVHLQSHVFLSQITELPSKQTGLSCTLVSLL